jgi:hypothetical protein
MRFERKKPDGTYAFEVEIADKGDASPEPDLVVRAYCRPNGKPEEMTYSAYATCVDGQYVPYGIVKRMDTSSWSEEDKLSFAKHLSRCVREFVRKRSEGGIPHGRQC